METVLDLNYIGGRYYCSVIRQSSASGVSGKTVKEIVDELLRSPIIWNSVCTVCVNGYGIALADELVARDVSVNKVRARSIEHLE